MTVELIVVAIAALIGGGGVAGAIANWRKVEPEKESIIISSAQGAVIVQSGVIDELRAELDRAHARIATLGGELHDEIDRLQRERDALRAENRSLRQRVWTLEKRLDELGVSTDESGQAEV